MADTLGPRSALVVTRNGAVELVEPAAGAPSGLRVTAARRVTAAPAGLGRLVPGAGGFDALAEAFVADAVVVTVSAATVVADPVVVLHVVDPAPSAAGNGAPGVSAFPRTVVEVGRSGQATVVEVVLSGPGARAGRAAGAADAGGCRSLVVPVTELEVGDDARLRYANLQVLDDGATCLAVHASRVGRDATLGAFTVGLGGAYARVRTDSDLAGQAGRSALLAAYLGTGHQVHDFRTLQDHHAPRTESELLFKGAVADTARSVYSGLIRIRAGAKGANALQTNNNLVLSEGAHADSVPNLDIDENDVRCSHASTVGPIDDEQRYYLESRGIEPAAAERLVVAGFFADLARRAPVPGVGAWLEEAVDRRLAGRLPSQRQDPIGGHRG
ncbi:MAG TPA: SufD family Fe-S cluster assembly protein [Acidimicrobiales bacterium]|nr:SufD family Fe-S cluster assembly protein [Acidimicrobiales bacterium]